MNVPLFPNSRLELRDPTGVLVGYFVPVAELNQNLIPKATPEQEEALRQELASTVWIDGTEVIERIIADLERSHGDQ